MIGDPAVTGTLLSLAPLKPRSDAGKYAGKANAGTMHGGAAEPEYSDDVDRGVPHMGTAP